MNLKHIEINIGKACNNKCVFCMSSKPSLWDIAFVKLDVLKERLSGYYIKGYRSVGFLGGDISIHPEIEEIFRYCKEIGFVEIQAISNSMRFEDYDFAQRIVEAGMTRINISVHSHVEEVEDLLTKVPGGLKKKLKAIDNFNYFFHKNLLKSPISINIVLNQKNYKTIVETVLYFYKIKGICDIRINFIWLDNSVLENWDFLKLSYTEFIPYLKKLIYVSLKYHIRITFDTIPYCIFYQANPNNFIAIIKRFLGENLDHIKEIDWINKNELFSWQDRKKNELKTQFHQCESCSYKNSCQGVWKSYGLLYGGEEFVPLLD